MTLIEAESEKINDLTEVDIMLIIITIGPVIHILSLIGVVGFVSLMTNGLINVLNMKSGLVRYRHALERFTNENKKNTKTQTEGFRQEATTPPHDETEEGWAKVVRKPALVSPVTIQGRQADDRHPRVMRR